MTAEDAPHDYERADPADDVRPSRTDPSCRICGGHARDHRHR